MPQDGSNNYQYPPGTPGVPNQTIESEAYNTFLDDLVVNDLNIPRPIHRGGTGADNADGALINLSGEKASQLVTNYDAHIWIPGSFYSAIGATNAPVAGHAFVGICYSSDPVDFPSTNLNVVVEARDQTDTTTPGRLYVREKKAGVWGAWIEQVGGSVEFLALADTRYVNVAGDTMTGDLSSQGKIWIVNTSPELALHQAAAGQTSNIIGRLAGVTRWAMQLNNGAAESGSNAGSDFALHSYTDAGAFLVTRLTINRATGRSDFGGPVTSSISLTSPYSSLFGAHEFAAKHGIYFNGNHDSAGTEWRSIDAGYTSAWVQNAVDGSVALTQSAATVAAGAATSMSREHSRFSRDGILTLWAANGINSIQFIPGAGGGEGGTINVGGTALYFQCNGANRATSTVNGDWNFYSPGVGSTITAQIPLSTVGYYGVIGNGPANGAGASGIGIGGIQGALGMNIAVEGTWSVWGNGSGMLPGGVWATSDGNLKNVTNTLDGGTALAHVNAIPVKTFTPLNTRLGKFLQAPGRDPMEEQIGWLAQDIEPYIPAAVTDVEVPPADLAFRAALLGRDEVEVAQDPTKMSEGERYLREVANPSIKAMNLSPMVAELWAAVQELSRQNTEMKAKLDALSAPP